MPSASSFRSVLITAAAVPFVLLASGCGNETKNDNAAAIEMKDIEAVDGTISDAMTDLDGVQAASTSAVGITGNSTASKPVGDASNASASPDKDTPAEDTEVVADQ